MNIITKMTLQEWLKSTEKVKTVLIFYVAVSLNNRYTHFYINFLVYTSSESKFMKLEIDLNTQISSSVFIILKFLYYNITSEIIYTQVK